MRKYKELFKKIEAEPHRAFTYIMSIFDGIYNDMMEACGREENPNAVMEIVNMHNKKYKRISVAINKHIEQRYGIKNLLRSEAFLDTIKSNILMDKQAFHVYNCYWGLSN